MSAPNWLGLLRWTMQHSDGTTDSTAQPLSTEDAKWLETVMKECVRDDPQRMNSVMLTLKGVVDGAPVPETLEDDLDELRDIVEQVDMAQILVRFQGHDVLLNVSEKEDLPMDIRCMSVGIIATCCQNNLQAQDLLFSQGCLERLVKLFARTDSPALAAKTLLSISALVRGHALAEEQFVLQYASIVFPKALEHLSQRALVSRALFLAHALLTANHASQNRITALESLLSEASVELIVSTETDVRDNAALLLDALLHCEGGWNRIHENYSTRFEQVVQERLVAIEGDADLTPEDREIELNRVNSTKMAFAELQVRYPDKRNLNNSQSDKSEENPQPPLLLM